MHPPHSLLTCIILAVLANPTPSHFIAVWKRVHGDIVDAGEGVAIAAALLAREAICRRAVPPRLIIVGGETRLTVTPLGIVLTLAERVQFGTTATGMSIACTPAVKVSFWLYDYAILAG